jgi:glutamate-1-semialdehyde 2,1-aminomutase
MTYQEAMNHAREVYCGKTQKSKEAFETARNYLAGGECRSIACFDPYPFTVDYGEGCRIHDIDGNVYIDFLNNYTSLIHGHAHPALTKAIADAAAKGTACPAGIPEQVELAKIICERMEHVDRVRFCNSGTEATMFAVRAARAFKKRDGVIKMLGGYHGTHDIVEFSVSPKIAPGVDLTKPIANEPGVPNSAGETVYIARYNSLDDVEAILKEHASDIACILVEPFLGTTGMIPAKPGYLQGLRELADQYDVLLVIDEVQGFRLSTGGAQKKFGVRADLCSFGKIIGGGLAVGAFGGRAEIMNLYDHYSNDFPLKQSGTFNGNRPTMAGGIAAMKLLDEAAFEKLEALGARLEAGMNKAIEDHQVNMSVTREGSLLNIHFVKEPPYDYETAYADKTPVSPLWYLEMVNGGIFPAPRGLFVISTVMTEKEIDKAIEVFAHSLDVISPYLT